MTITAIRFLRLGFSLLTMDEMTLISAMAEPSFSFEVSPRSEAVGGGWNLKLYLGKEEMGGGVFEPGDEGYAAAYSEGFAWQYQRL